MGIEPTSEAWEASILPLYDARSEPNANKPPRLLQELFVSRLEYIYPPLLYATSDGRITDVILCHNDCF